MPHQIHQQDPKPRNTATSPARIACASSCPIGCVIPDSGRASALDCASKFGYGLPGLSVEKEVARATSTDQRSLCFC